MTHVSRRRIDLATENFLNSLVKSTFLNLKGPELFKILSTTLSETEMTMVKKRLGVILLLNKNLRTEDIMGTFKVTRQTVSRIGLFLKTLPPDSRKLLFNRLNKGYLKEAIKTFVNSIDISRSSFRKKMANLEFIR